MIPDISLPAGIWHNVYTASGISAGTPIMIQSKAGTPAFLWEGPVAPDANGMDGVHICFDPWVVDQVGVSGCWIKSNGTILISVQVCSP